MGSSRLGPAESVPTLLRVRSSFSAGPAAFVVPPSIASPSVVPASTASPTVVPASVIRDTVVDATVVDASVVEASVVRASVTFPAVVGASIVHASRRPLLEGPRGLHQRSWSSSRKKIGREISPYVRSPDLRCIASARVEAGIDGGEMPQDIAGVAEKEILGTAVV
jgi:hypothetical protein